MKRLTESFREVLDIANALQVDVALAREKLVPVVLASNSGNGDPKAVAFWTRTTIRCFLGFLDGLSFAMRQAVRRCAKDAGITLTYKEQENLKDTHLPTLDSLKLACRTFPRLFGSDYSLNTTGNEWLGLHRIVKVRKRFTHPKVFEDLAVHPALPVLLPTIIWTLREIMILFSDIEQRLGLGPARQIPDLEPIREAPPPWVDVFKDEDYRLIQSEGGRTLEYAKRMFFMLSEDTGTAMDFTKEAFPSSGVPLSPALKFAFRSYARTLSSEIEGTISAVRFFLEAAVARKKVTLSETEELSLINGELEERFVAACNLWAHHFGNGYVLEKSGENWKHLRGTRAFRNRITHPKSLESLKVDLGLMDTLLGAHGFFLEGWGDGLYLDPEKFAEKAGGIEEAIEREKTRAHEDPEAEEDLEEETM